MNDQLPLLDEDDESRNQYRRLDAHTRDVGRKGVALAREALRQAVVRSADGRQAA